MEILGIPHKNIAFVPHTQRLIQKKKKFSSVNEPNASSLSIREKNEVFLLTLSLSFSLKEKRKQSQFAGGSLHLQLCCCSPSSQLPLEGAYLKYVEPHLGITLNASCTVSLPQSQPRLESNNSEIVISWQNIVFLLAIILSGNWGSAVESTESLTVLAGLNLL